MQEYYVWLYFEQRQSFWRRLFHLGEERQVEVRALLDTGAKLGLCLPANVAKMLKIKYTGRRIRILGYGGKKTDAKEALVNFKLKWKESEYEFKDYAIYVSPNPEVIVGLELMQECGIGIN